MREGCTATTEEAATAKSGAGAMAAVLMVEMVGGAATAEVARRRGAWGLSCFWTSADMSSRSMTPGS